MSAFVVTGVVMLVCLLPMSWVALRGSIMEAIVAYQAASSIVVMVLVVLAEGFGRSGLFEFPILLAALLLGGGLVFLRMVERWL